MWWLWIFIVRLKGYKGWSKDLFPGKIETSLSRSYRCTRVWWEMWESISLLGVTQYYTYPLTNIHTLIYIFKCWSVGKLVYINGFKCLLGFSHTLSTIWNWLQLKQSGQISKKSFRRGLAWSLANCWWIQCLVVHHLAESILSMYDTISESLPVFEYE